MRGFLKDHSGVFGPDATVLRKLLRRGQVLAFFSRIPYAAQNTKV
jgi:hypothetical protein